MISGQEGSDRRGCVDGTEEVFHTTGSQKVDIVDAVRSGAHSGDQSCQFRGGVRGTGCDLRGLDDHLLRK